MIIHWAVNSLLFLLFGSMSCYLEASQQSEISSYSLTSVCETTGGARLCLISVVDQLFVLIGDRNACDLANGDITGFRL